MLARPSEPTTKSLSKDNKTLWLLMVYPYGELTALAVSKVEIVFAVLGAKWKDFRYILTSNPFLKSAILAAYFLSAADISNTEDGALCSDKVERIG
jgi:hypothetical protein